MVEKLAKITIISISIFVIFGLGYNFGKLSSETTCNELLKAYQDYENNVEILLDSIYTQYPDFMDTIMETDEYFYYYTSKKKKQINQLTY